MTKWPPVATPPGCVQNNGSAAAHGDGLLLLGPAGQYARAGRRFVGEDVAQKYFIKMLENAGAGALYGKELCPLGHPLGAPTRPRLLLCAPPIRAAVA
ncbi:unnamed protein product, partial [Amoebophrya sp. A120]|eukprot:GSA120T00021211001.1